MRRTRPSITTTLNPHERELSPRRDITEHCPHTIIRQFTTTAITIRDFYIEEEICKLKFCQAVFLRFTAKLSKINKSCCFNISSSNFVGRVCVQNYLKGAYLVKIEKKINCGSRNRLETMNFPLRLYGWVLLCNYYFLFGQTRDD